MNRYISAIIFYSEFYISVEIFSNLIHSCELLEQSSESVYYLKNSAVIFKQPFSKLFTYKSRIFDALKDVLLNICGLILCLFMSFFSFAVCLRRLYNLLSLFVVWKFKCCGNSCSLRTCPTISLCEFLAVKKGRHENAF